jgi:hypothetical protein
MFKTFIFWVGLPHEACHYLTACALGLSAQIESGYTSVERGSWWKEELVLLSPLVVGVVLVLFRSSFMVIL